MTEGDSDGLPPSGLLETDAHALDVARVRRRFLVLRGLRWLPTGLLIPVLVVLLLDRGLSLGDIGVVIAAQGLLVLALELPTGGLADALGRRPVLLAASLFDLATIALLVFADTVPLLLVAFGLQGVYRALESGPLDSWFVDTTQAADAGANIGSGLAVGGTVIGVAISAGSLFSSGLVALAPLPSVDPLITPLLLAGVLRAVEMGAIAKLMVEPTGWRTVSLRATAREVPHVIAAAARSVRRSRALLALAVVELLWGFGMVSFEMFTPARLEQLLPSAGAAATWLGPANTAAWLASAVGAALVPALTGLIGPVRAAAGLRVVQAVTVLGIAWFTGPATVVAAYVATLAVHGASNPIHQGMLHRAVTDPRRRATVVSANNMASQVGGMLGGIALGVLADASGLTAGIVVGAAVLAAAAPLYVFAGPPAAETAVSAPRSELAPVEATSRRAVWRSRTPR
ncbi:MAG: MFS transporter [Actinobacteria bacterium]|nr:MFS transporter [Actinomycetota bacterium]